MPPKLDRWAEADAYAVAGECTPRSVVGLDRSQPYLLGAQARTPNRRASFVVADACNLPLRAACADVAVSALVLNFVAEPARMVAAMAHATRPGGTVALYVWDYAHVELMRFLWDAAVELDPDAADLDEGLRFSVCAPEPLRLLFDRAGLDDVDVRSFEVPTRFRDFDDYWRPFLGGQGPAPGYVVSLDERVRARLRELVRRRLPHDLDGSIPLVARAWAARGSVA